MPGGTLENDKVLTFASKGNMEPDVIAREFTQAIFADAPTGDQNKTMTPAKLKHMGYQMEDDDDFEKSNFAKALKES